MTALACRRKLNNPCCLRRGTKVTGSPVFDCFKPKIYLRDQIKAGDISSFVRTLH